MATGRAAHPGELMQPRAGGAGVAWRAVRPWFAWLGAALLLGWLLAIAWWAFLSPEARESITDELVIPRGTAVSLRSGSPIAFVPAEVTLRPGDRLVVVNNDVEEHTIGNAVIPPGATAELSAPESGDGFYCTIHPTGFLGVKVAPRPHFLTTMVSALVVGVPLGLMAGAASWAGRRNARAAAHRGSRGHLGQGGGPGDGEDHANAKADAGRKADPA
jgi:plastocyanin